MKKDNYTYNFSQIKCWFHSKVIYVQGIQGLGMWHYQEGQKTKNKTIWNMPFLFITNILIHEALNKNLEQQDGNLTHLNQQHEKR
jgi:hypothetical protein